MPQARRVVVPVRIGDRKRLRQRLTRQVVIANDDVRTRRPRGRERRMRLCSAIDGDDDPCALARELRHRGDVRPVPLAQAIRDIDDGISTQRSQEPHKQRRRRCSVDIVVPEDRDPLALLHRLGQARCSAVHILDAARVRQIPLQRRIQVRVRRTDADTPRRQQPPDDLSRVQPLRNRKRRRRIARPLDPPPPQRRSRHAEISRRLVQSLSRRRHARRILMVIHGRQ